jgi:hypothetical protein
MDDHAGRITIIASSTMVQHSIKCMICGRPVDHRVVFMTNDARVLHAGCVPDHVKVPMPVLLQAIRRLERMVERARAGNNDEPDSHEPESLQPGSPRDPSGRDDPGSLPGPGSRDGPDPPSARGREAPEPGPGAPGT